MKAFRSFISVLTVAAVVLSLGITAFAETQTATVEFSTVSSETLSNNTLFTTYDITGSVCGDSAKSYVFEFSPADGNIPLAFTGTAGGVTFMEKHMNYAADEGYEVVGAINGSFFQGSTSTMTGMLISNGRIIIGDSGAMEALACFDSKGVLSHVNNPSIKYPVFLNGVETGSLVSINKKYTYIEEKSSTSSKLGEFFYYDRHVLNCYSPIAKSDVSGYEILCDKLDHTEIAVGRTLKGKVVSVTESTFGATIPENDSQFVLFVKTDSPYISAVSGLKAGDSITIGAEAQGYVTELENAYSAISSAYWLVKDGVDQTNKNSTIIHSVTLERAWTAFGVKADGSFVYFVNEEYGLTLKDVAAAMIEMGCTNVIRLDGGGSSAVYTETNGIVYLAERPEENGRMVCDTLLIVKKTSLSDDELKTELESSLQNAKEIKTDDINLKNAIEYAEKVLSDNTPTQGELKKALSGLDLKSVLSDVIAQGDKAVEAHYSAEDYATLKTALDSAKALASQDNADGEAIKNAITAVSDALALSKYQIISVGASYEVTAEKNYSYWADTKLLHDDGVRLSDGFKSNGNVLSNAYSGWRKDQSDKVSVVIDLGENAKSNSYTVYTAANFWGVAACANISVSGSNDKENFIPIGESDKIDNLGNGELIEGKDQSTLHSLTVKSDYLYDYRYIKLDLTINGGFLWADEIEIALDENLPMKEPVQQETSSQEPVSSEETVSQETEASAEASQSENTQISDNSQGSQDDGNVTTIIVIAVVAVAVIAVAVVLILKSKKK